AAAFSDYYMQAENLAAVGEGDCLIPTTGEARDALATATEGQTGWAEMLASGAVLEAAPFQLAVNYPQWKDQYATPTFQQYLSNSTDIAHLTAQLTAGWESTQ